MNNRVRQRTDDVGVLSNFFLVLVIVAHEVSFSFGFIWYVVSASRRSNTSNNFLSKVNALFQLLVSPGALQNLFHNF